jgi:hypothetical protein
MERARLRLENTLTAMSTIYTQTMLVGAKDIDSGRARRLRDEIAEEVNELVRRPHGHGRSLQRRATRPQPESVRELSRASAGCQNQGGLLPLPIACDKVLHAIQHGDPLAKAIIRYRH